MNSANRSFPGVLLALTLALGQGNATAWSYEGHQVVAKLAGAQLTAKTKARTERLLALERPGATLDSISMWADQTKNRSTARWHFVNFQKTLTATMSGKETALTVNA